MRSLVVLLTIAGLLIQVACVSMNSTSNSKLASPQMQTAKHFKLRGTHPLEMNYLLFLPKEYDGKKRSPMMLFLHGSGERGTNIWKVATHGPPKNVAEHREFPFILVSPQCPEGQDWSKDVLLALLEEMMRKYAVDTNRIYLTGLSMGGYGTWDLGLSYPEKFAAIAPICGGGEMISLLLSSREKGQALKTLAVWAFHGAKDPVVPLEESERMVEAVKKAGVREVKFTVYPEAGHDSWTETYQNPELYLWFLEHQRRPRVE